jgi:hypothetical protein
MRSGDEPGHARSPLRLRFGLAGFGLITALIAAVVVHRVAPAPVVIGFVAIAVLAAVDLVVVGYRIRLGPHFQPGPQIPPYRPVEPEPKVRPVVAPPTEQVRIRRYLIIMVSCLVLIVVAWFWVRLYSTTAAVVMSMVAAVLPPIAVVIANFGVQLPEPPPAPDRPDPPI